MAEGLTYVASAFGVGGAGLLARHYSITPIFIGMTAVQLAAVVYVLVFLKESRLAEKILEGKSAKRLSSEPGN